MMIMNELKCYHFIDTTSHTVEVQVWPPEPEAVGSNPALPESNCISRKQLLVKLFFLAVRGILVSAQ